MVLAYHVTSFYLTAVKVENRKKWEEGGHSPNAPFLMFHGVAKRENDARNVSTVCSHEPPTKALMKEMEEMGTLKDKSLAIIP